MLVMERRSSDRLCLQRTTAEPESKKPASEDAGFLFFIWRPKLVPTRSRRALMFKDIPASAKVI